MADYLVKNNQATENEIDYSDYNIKYDSRDEARKFENIFGSCNID